MGYNGPLLITFEVVFPLVQKDLESAIVSFIRMILEIYRMQQKEKSNVKGNIFY